MFLSPRECVYFVCFVFCLFCFVLFFVLCCVLFCFVSLFFVSLSFVSFFFVRLFPPVSVNVALFLSSRWGWRWRCLASLSFSVYGKNDDDDALYVRTFCWRRDRILWLLLTVDDSDHDEDVQQCIGCQPRVMLWRCRCQCIAYASTPSGVGEGVGDDLWQQIVLS